MLKTKVYEKLTNLYPLSKTLRFELKPVGETADYLEDFKSQHLKGFVKKDQQRASDYQIIKEIIDDYHRDYIEGKLSSPANPETGEMWITPEDIEEAFSYYEQFKKDSKDNNNQESWGKMQTALRKKLVKSFVGNGDLFKKELITRDLPAWLKLRGKWEENKTILESFNKFTTYFSGFHDNRKNMYTDKDQRTAIAYRVINENLPRFFNNYIHFKHITEKYNALSLKANADLLSRMGVENLSDIFQPRYFVNLFAQSGIDNYQQLLGGKTEETGEKQQGLNEQINLFKQQVQKRAKTLAEENNEKPKKIYDLSGFTGLYKQILSDRDSTSFIPEAFDDDKQLLQSLSEYIELTTQKGGLLDKLETAITRLAESDIQNVYIKETELTSISHSVFNNYRIITSSLEDYAEKTLKNKTSRKAYLEQKTFSLAELDEKLVSYSQNLEENDPLHTQLEELSDPQHPIKGYFLGAIKAAKAKQNDKPDYDSAIDKVKLLLSLEALSKQRKAPENSNEKGGEGFQQIHAIQQMLDVFMAISHAVKPLHLVDGHKAIEVSDIDMGFYSEFLEAYENYVQPTNTLYNKTRNHLTKKPFSTDKIKINFDVPTLLNGWDANKEPDNASILFEKDGLYYLGIMHPKHKHLFNYIQGIDDAGNEKKISKKAKLLETISEQDGGGYRKIIYKLLPGANKMLPKVFFSNSRIQFFSPSDEIIKIRNTASHSKNGNPQKGYKKEDFNLKDCHEMIDFFKASITKHPEWKEFRFQFSPTNMYDDLSGFYREVEHQGYRVNFHHIKESYIDDCVALGKLFLFQIYNKDFSPYSKGKPNLHTLYWKGLFEPENLKDVVLKLNGEAEIFYRQHSIKRGETPIHSANEAILNKNDNNPNKQSTFAYDIIKNKRYTQDKFQFHVPITLNFKAQGVNRFNDQINKALQKSNNTHIIGIDRGERHLLYYTVVNTSGEIIEQGSLNEISTDQGYKVDYQQKLHAKEKEREKARKSWSSVENIKELKAGYLSHVVHKLAKLIIKHNAIVCLEDLNFGFKRGRFHIEKQVYQKFEKALIDKLNYLVFKENEQGEEGHYLKAYQLTAPFESFENLGKQSGILYYVPAAYTSKIDPETGFTDLLKISARPSLSESKDVLGGMDSILFNPGKNYFEFKFDYGNLKTKKGLKGKTTLWSVCTHGDIRYSYSGINNPTQVVNVSERLKLLLDEYKIEYKEGQELKEQLITVKNSKFYKIFFWLLRLTMSLRYSLRDGEAKELGISDANKDFILSPIADKNGVFFDSRNATDQQPKDADANGAYNIALKGLWNLQQIKEWDGEANLNLAMKNEDWFSFIHDRINK